MSALGRAMLALWYGFPLDPADADELGRIFDETPLYGVGEPDHCEACAGGECARCEIWTCGCGHEGVSEALSGPESAERGSGGVVGPSEGDE